MASESLPASFEVLNAKYRHFESEDTHIDEHKDTYTRPSAKAVLTGESRLFGFFIFRLPSDCNV
jgi:hypothetical protein